MKNIIASFPFHSMKYSTHPPSNYTSIYWLAAAIQFIYEDSNAPPVSYVIRLHLERKSYQAQAVFALRYGYPKQLLKCGATVCGELSKKNIRERVLIGNGSACSIRRSSLRVTNLLKDPELVIEAQPSLLLAYVVLLSNSSLAREIHRLFWQLAVQRHHHL